MFKKDKSSKSSQLESQKANLLELYTRQLRGEKLSRAERKLLDKHPDQDFRSVQQVLSGLYQHEPIMDDAPRLGALQRVENALMDAIHEGRSTATVQAMLPRFAYSREQVGSDSELIQTTYEVGELSTRHSVGSAWVTLQCLDDGSVAEERTVVVPCVTIGRGIEASLQFPESDRLSRLHARLDAIAGTLYLTDLESRNGVYLEGNLLRERYPLAEGEAFELGELVLQVAEFIRHEQGMEVALHQVKDGRTIRTHRLVLPQITLGRGNTATLSFDDPTRKISRLHAQLDSADGRLHITDLVSSNGTYVEGQRITERTGLEAGNLIRMGGIHLQVVSIQWQEES